MPRGVKGSAGAKVSQTPPASFSAADKRQLELRIECLKAELEEAVNNYNHEKGERIRAETREREVRKELEKERQDGNLLRTAVHDLEIDYAKLRGYIDGQHDSEPPRMVPEQRERRLSSYPDGTRLYNVNARYGQPETEWWKR